jgi:hypothetical protein
MNRYYLAIRQPVRRPRVDAYLLLTLLSFALSVSLIRFFLELTGYPQLGGGVLHISHVLWGGLLLFIAAMLPLILANRWVYWVVSILAGVGIGLFIDEVGKFITQSYDYFFPAAAPIMYAFFLICVLVYMQISRPRPRSARSELYASLELMEEVLDHDLDVRERLEIKNRLTYVVENESNPNLIRLANELLDYFSDDQLYLAPDRPKRLQRLADYLQSAEEKYVNQERLQRILVIGLGLLGIASVIIPGKSLIEIALFHSELEGVELFWFISMLVIQLLTGLALIFSAFMLISNRERIGLRISFIGLLIYLTIVNLFLFYYNQFSTILAAIVQFVLLMAVIYYQQRYNPGKSEV